MGNKKLKFPLRCIVKNDVLLISIGANELAFATDNHPGYWDGESGENTFKVSDKSVWLKNVATRINHEEEDGSTFLTKMLDDAISDAINQGEEGLEP